MKERKIQKSNDVGKLKKKSQQQQKRNQLEEHATLFSCVMWAKAGSFVCVDHLCVFRRCQFTPEYIAQLWTKLHGPIPLHLISQKPSHPSAAFLLCALTSLPRIDLDSDSHFISRYPNLCKSHLTGPKC